MKRSPEQKGHARRNRGRPVGGRGLTLVEILVGMTIMAIGVLGTLGMFSAGFDTVGIGGKTTMAITAARQMLEDVRLVPFGNLPNLNNFDTNTAGTQPGGGVERAIARKWRYALAGENTGAGWTFSVPEKQQWSMLLSGVGNGSSVSGRGLITVAGVGVPPTMRQVTVTVWIPAQGRSVTVSTRISRP